MRESSVNHTSELTSSLSQYQTMLEEMMKKHQEELKKMQRLTDEHIQKNKLSSEDFVDQLKREHNKSIKYLENRINDLEKDCELKDVQIKQSKVELDHSEHKISIIESRLER